MITMTEDITAKNQKLFNKSITKQVKTHDQMMENVNIILAGTWGY